jgi:hypothetical protein
MPITTFMIEHAPPRAGQSSLGDAVTTVLTCGDCNGGASRYEGRTQEVRKIIRDTSRIGLHYAAGGHPAFPATLTVQGRRNLLCTDLKAAFVVAFATLGYQFALARQLDPIREAIMTGTPPLPRYARLARVEYPRPGSLVIEVHGPYPCIIVLAGNGNAVLMPMPGHPEIPADHQFGDVRTRVHEWPDHLGPHKSGAGHHRMIGEAHKAGTLFHADYCHHHGWA